MFPFGLILSIQQPVGTILYFPSAILSQISGNVLPRILRNLLSAMVALMQERGDKRLIAAQKQYKYECNKCVLETRIFGRNEFVVSDRPPLAVNRNSSKPNHKPTYNNLIPRSDGPYGNVCVQHHSQTIVENNVPNTISRKWVAPTTYSSTNAGIVQEPFVFKRINPAINKNDQGSEGEFLKSEWFDTNNDPYFIEKAANVLQENDKSQRMCNVLTLFETRNVWHIELSLIWFQRRSNILAEL